MIDLQDLYAAHSAPQHLEQLYREARSANEVEVFAAGIRQCHDEFPDNLLYATWYYRLLHDGPVAPSERPRLNWKLALPLSLLTGLIFWALSDHPEILIFWAPIAAVAVLSFLAFASRSQYKRSILIGVLLLGLGAYLRLFIAEPVPRAHQRALELVVLHLPLLAWAGVGIGVIGLRPSRSDRFAFLSKSFEVLAVAAVYLIIGGVFATITFQLFDALRIHFSDSFWRFVVAGGSGLVPVLAVASVYDPTLGVATQAARVRLGRITSILIWLLVGLTLIVLVAYLCTIPSKFMEPFTNRNTLMIYNYVLFAIMGLLFGIASIRVDELSPRAQMVLRGAILAIALMAALAGLHALAAIVYRATLRGITINRFAAIGWDVINIAILLLLIFGQIRRGGRNWLDSLRSVFSLGIVVYLLWVLVLILALSVILFIN
jgi:hypothetical protein